MHNDKSKAEMLNATETAVWICSILGLPIDHSFHNDETTVQELSRRLKSSHEDNVGAKEVNTCNKLAAILAKMPNNTPAKHYKLYKKLSVPTQSELSSDVPEHIRDVFFKIDSNTIDANFILTESDGFPISRNQEAISYLCHKLVPDTNELSDKIARISFVLPYPTMSENLDGYKHSWELMELQSDWLKQLSKDKTWALRLVIAFQIAGLSWINPDKNKLLYRVLSALNLTSKFNALDQESEAGDRPVTLRKELESEAKSILKKHQTNTGNIGNIELQCSLPTSPERQKLKEIYPLKNQETKSNQLKRDLKSIRQSLSHTLTSYSGVIVSFELPIEFYQPEKILTKSNFPSLSHYFPIICTPDLFYDYLSASRPLDDSKLKDEYRKLRRNEVKQSKSNEILATEQQKLVYWDPDSPDYNQGSDWQVLIYQKAVKLRKYLNKTYKKSNPLLLNSTMPFQITVMYWVFKDTTPDITIYEGVDHKLDKATKHYWLNIKGYIVDISLIRRKGGIEKGFTVVAKESKWHQSITDIVTYDVPPDEGYGLNDSKNIFTIIGKAVESVKKEIIKENEILLKKGKL